MAREVSNQEDVLDSRDIIARIEHLRSEIEAAYEDAKGEATEFPPIVEWTDTDDCPALEMVEELKTLEAFQSEAEGYAPDWRHGATLIRRNYFKDYCEELVSDIGDMPREIPSYIVIDWQATANNIEVDYTTVDFDGVEYLVR